MDIFHDVAVHCLNDWPDIKVLTVPGVMLQVRVAENSHAEYRIHWIKECAETYVHNHRFGFETLCVAGGYVEQTWEVDGTNSAFTTYQFPRKDGNVIGAPVALRGRLHITETRQHAPGNVMRVAPNRFHSIEASAAGEAVTFVTRFKCALEADTSILSSSTTIEAPTEQLRDATSEERRQMYSKIRSLVNHERSTRIQLTLPTNERRSALPR